MKIDEALELWISVINKFILFWKFGRSRSHGTVEVANSNVYSSSSSRDRYRNRDRREGRTFRAAWVVNGRFEANVAVRVQEREREREKNLYGLWSYLPTHMDAHACGTFAYVPYKVAIRTRSNNKSDASLRSSPLFAFAPRFFTLPFSFDKE